MLKRSDHLTIEVTVAQARALLSLLNADAFDDEALLARAFPHTTQGHRVRLLRCALRVADAIEDQFATHQRHAAFRGETP